MSIEWFQKSPNSLPTAEDGMGGHMMLVGGEPDYVRLPPELGGNVVRVLSTFVAPCPVTGAPCKHYELEDGVFVAESDKYYWYSCKR